MRFISKKELRSLVLYSHAHIARLEAKGLFPKRVQLGAGRVGYVDEEVEDWINQRIAERDGRTAS